MWPAGPLPEGPQLPVVTEPPSPPSGFSLRARQSPVRQLTKGFATGMLQAQGLVPQMECGGFSRQKVQPPKLCY
eukprot:1152402-Pelagomonas_calceolata.AAC.1